MYFFYRSLGVIEELIEAGGKEFVLMPTYDGLTPLHQACECTDHTPFREQEVIDLLLDVGRENLLFPIDHQSESTAIDLEGNKSDPSQSVLDRFIEIGGERARNLYRIKMRKICLVVDYKYLKGFLRFVATWTK